MLGLQAGFLGCAVGIGELSWVPSGLLMCKKGQSAAIWLAWVQDSAFGCWVGVLPPVWAACVLVSLIVAIEHLKGVLNWQYCCMGCREGPGCQLRVLGQNNGPFLNDSWMAFRKSCRNYPQRHCYKGLLSGLFKNLLDCLFLVLDRNTWSHISVCKLFLYGGNTWYHSTMRKKNS